MTTTGQLALGATQIIATGTGELLGYAYAEATPTGQLQRWILYRNPQNTFEIRPPPSPMTGWSLGDWKASVPMLWRPGSFYVRAKADVYRHGETYGGVQWTQIPPASKLPDPSYPEGPGDSHQLDPTGSILPRIYVEEIFNEPFGGGLAFTVDGLLSATSVEYWMLPGSYKPAGGGSNVTRVALGSEEAQSLGEFIDLANKSFGAGSLFVITGCVNYNGAQPPAML